MSKEDIQIKNKKAYFDFQIDQSLEAGVQLKGSEVKSIREGRVNLSEAYCFVDKEELWIVNMHITEYSHGSVGFNHEPLRRRKMLIHKKELKKFQAQVQEKGMSIIPLKLYINSKGLVKILIGLGKGKKNFDKRESIKEKDTKRLVDRELKKYK